MPDVHVTYPRVSFEHRAGGISCDPIRATWDSVMRVIVMTDAERGLLATMGKVTTSNGTELVVAREVA